MGLMDKMKASAEQAIAKGKVVAEKGVEKSKEGVAHGQAKVKEMQDKRGAKEADAPAGDYKLDDA
jgi:hypothetical protein